MTPGSNQWKLTFEISPIILVGGIASNIPGGLMPIISLTQTGSFPTGITGVASPAPSSDLDSYFAHFYPVENDIIDQQIGEYPFANQQIAANAVIVQPLEVSMMMICPAQMAGGYALKLAVITALQKALYQHNTTGGTYNVATPSYYYTNCVMTNMKAILEEDTKQPQVAWQLNFRQPLITLAAAAASQNALMSKISSGSQINGQPPLSGGSPTVGQPASQASTSAVPAATGSGAAGTVTPTNPMSGLANYSGAGVQHGASGSF